MHRPMEGAASVRFEVAMQWLLQSVPRKLDNLGYAMARMEREWLFPDLVIETTVVIQVHYVVVPIQLMAPSFVSNGPFTLF